MVGMSGWCPQLGIFVRETGWVMVADRGHLPRDKPKGDSLSQLVIHGSIRADFALEAGNEEYAWLLRQAGIGREDALRWGIEDSVRLAIGLAAGAFIIFLPAAHVAFQQPLWPWLRNQAEDVWSKILVIMDVVPDLGGVHFLGFGNLGYENTGGMEVFRAKPG